MVLDFSVHSSIDLDLIDEILQSDIADKTHYYYYYYYYYSSSSSYSY